MESCGFVSGKGDMPACHMPMTNVAQSDRFYELDPAELVEAYGHMDERGEDPVIIYHSHTATHAVPSALDLSLATEPGAHYVIVATGDWFEFRSWRIADGAATEEGVIVVDENDRFDPIRS
ncbi:metalloprotease [Streptomyces phage Dryad]|nr:metalloprotease [Streptomyces phage Dryad]